MKNRTSLCLCLGLLAGIATALPGANNKDFDVLISSDAIYSPEGFRPKPGKPVRYIMRQTQQTLGEPVAGVKLPDPATVESAIVAELEKQGFIQAKIGEALPQIMILATVGDANFKPPQVPIFVNPLYEPELDQYLRLVNVRDVLRSIASRSQASTVDELFGGPDTEYPSSNSDVNEARDAVLAEAIRIQERMSERGRDRSKILALVGAPKVDRAVAERAMSSSAAEQIAWATRDNLYYVSLSAFDAKAWQEKQRVLLWRTTMLIDWRKDLGKSLAAMLAKAGPMFGTDVAVPGFVNTATREGTVEIGDAKVVPEKGDAATKGTKK
jgi:hypothetical protein